MAKKSCLAKDLERLTPWHPQAQPASAQLQFVVFSNLPKKSLLEATTKIEAGLQLCLSFWALPIPAIRSTHNIQMHMEYRFMKSSIIFCSIPFLCLVVTELMFPQNYPTAHFRMLNCLKRAHYMWKLRAGKHRRWPHWRIDHQQCRFLFPQPSAHMNQLHLVISNNKKNWVFLSCFAGNVQLGCSSGAASANVLKMKCDTWLKPTRTFTD